MQVLMQEGCVLVRGIMIYRRLCMRFTGLVYQSLLFQDRPSGRVGSEEANWDDPIGKFLRIFIRAPLPELCPKQF
jgi:hypothetical protein